MRIYLKILNYKIKIMDWKEIWKLYKQKFFAALGAFIFIASGLVLYEFKNFDELSGETPQAHAQANAQNNSQAKAQDNSKIFENFKYESDYEREREREAQVKYIQVYITGAIKNSDVYKIKSGSRLNDLVKMAGGLTIQADREEINLARILNTDGEHIKIKFKEFEPKKGANFISLKPEQKSQAQAKNNSKSQNKSKSKSAKREKVYEKVNINTAGLDELTKLKGIGPALAQRILDYRNSNGSFKSVQDLKKVRGIGDAKLKALKDQVIL